jgi:hypothetical protein
MVHILIKNRPGIVDLLGGRIQCLFGSTISVPRT